MRPLNLDTIEHLISDTGDASDSAEHRRAAFETFRATPMPSPKDEAWRYVELELDLDALGLPEGPGERIEADPFVTSADDAIGYAAVVDGFVVDVRNDGNAFFEARPASMIEPSNGDKFAAAHVAFNHERIVLEVPPGAVVERPYVIDVQATQTGVISFPSISVEAGRGSDVAVLALFRSAEGEVVQAPSVELAAADGANLRFTTAQVLDGAATSITRQRVRIGRDATVRVGEVGLGGAFARLDLGVDLVGDGSSAEVVGLYFGEHEQVLDYRMVMNHIGRNTSSDVYLKGAVEDESRSVFTGLLRIEKEAVRTSAFETNRNLVLSPGATAHSVPNLEILCDDVICGHGSSVGPLEEDHLYYLQSRGLSRARAERLLIRGFFSEVIDRLPSKRLAAPIGDVVYRRFSEAQMSGRIS